MDSHAYFIKIPFEIGDLIKAEGYENRFIIEDIIHTYSCKERCVNNVYFKLRDIDLNTIFTKPYKDHTWQMIKTNKEMD